MKLVIDKLEVEVSRVDDFINIGSQSVKSNRYIHVAIENEKTDINSMVTTIEKSYDGSFTIVNNDNSETKYTGFDRVEISNANSNFGVNIVIRFARSQDQAN